jgi:hypothetical protein
MRAKPADPQTPSQTNTPLAEYRQMGDLLEAEGL